MLGALALEDRPWPRRAARGASPRRCSTASATSASTRCPGRRPPAASPPASNGCARNGAADLPDFSPDGLLAGLDAWLGPVARRHEPRRRPRAPRPAAPRSRPASTAASGSASTAWRRPAITAPTGTTLPDRLRRRVAPRVSVRLQEMFGLTRHPTVGAGGAPLVIELLSPAQRPVQTTADLPGFWATSYADVRRDLRGRYAEARLARGPTPPPRPPVASGRRPRRT